MSKELTNTEGNSNKLIGDTFHLGGLEVYWRNGWNRFKKYSPLKKILIVTLSLLILLIIFSGYYILNYKKNVSSVSPVVKSIDNGQLLENSNFEGGQVQETKSDLKSGTNQKTEGIAKKSIGKEVIITITALMLFFTFPFWFPFVKVLVLILTTRGDLHYVEHTKINIKFRDSLRELFSKKKD